jgi:uncharacterized paraquat-inducible protein A
MYIMGTNDYPVTRPELKGTLWHCEKCDSFVSLHSARVVREALCPMCTVELELCGTFDSILGWKFADA